MEIHNTTLFWTYKLQNFFWEQLKCNFNKNELYLSSFKNNQLRKNDVVFIYQTHINHNKSGFVCVCQTKSNMVLNNDSKRVYTDKNMNKYIVELSSVYILDSSVKIATMFKTIQCFTARSFTNEFIGNHTCFTKVDNKLGNEIVDFLINYECNTESTLSEQSNCDVRIPILVEPCDNFNWNKSENEFIKQFKHHYKNCALCKITDNNSNTLLKFKDVQININNLTYNGETEEILSKYHNLENCDVISNEITLNKIINRGSMYHKSIVIT